MGQGKGLEALIKPRGCQSAARRHPWPTTYGGDRRGLRAARAYCGYDSMYHIWVFYGREGHEIEGK